MRQLDFKANKPRRARKIISVLACLIIVALTLVQTWRIQYAAVAPQDKTQVDVVIPEKSGASQVAVLLKQNGLIRSELVFRYYCSQNNLATVLKPGHYRFNRSQTLPEIAQMIAQGKIVSTTVTVPEGYTVEQIGRLLVEKNLVTAADWQAALKEDYNFSFLPAVGGRRQQRLEGFLFPDTYNIELGAPAHQIVNLMLERFQKAWEPELAALAQEQKRSPLEVVTIASIIEREAMVAEERETISGVIKNRLDKKMALQMCSTVLYVLKQDKPTLSIADTKIDSYYNTYKYTGLPPGPIASPGIASLQAALHPQKHNYLYFVAKGDGTHQFSVTNAEHLAAIKKYQK
ncbi:MAG: endolytic transglycosylase MltG [Syntrophomonadaceae bacterium]